MLYLSRADVERINLPMTGIISSLESMFREKGQGKTEMPPKPGIHPLPDSFIHAMPAFIPGVKAAGMKWVSGFPDNQKKGLPYISGLLILNDPETGIPIAVMDCGWITAKRTGAATALSAKYLARPDSHSIGIVACGVQGRSNLEALHCLYKITTVKAFDRFPEVARKFAAEMGAQLGLEIEPVAQLKDAVINLDIVVTSGPILKKLAPPIQAGWLAKGSFASAVDFDSMWTGEAIAEIDRLGTDDIPQMEYYREDGYFQKTPRAYADLGELVTGSKPGRQSASERTMAMNLGIALEDMATAILIYTRARTLGIGLELPL